MSFVGGLEVLSEPLRAELDHRKQAGEKILYCVSPRKTRPGLFDHPLLGTRNWLDAVVAFDERLLYMHAPEEFFDTGEPGGIDFQVESIPYPAIEKVKVGQPDDMPAALNPFIYLIIVTGKGETRLLMPRKAHEELLQFAYWLIERVRQARSQPQDSPAANTEDINLLARLEELYRQGHLTEAEYQAARRKLGHE